MGVLNEVRSRGKELLDRRLMVEHSNIFSAPFAAVVFTDHGPEIVFKANACLRFGVALVELYQGFFLQGTQNVRRGYLPSL